MNGRIRPAYTEDAEYVRRMMDEADHLPAGHVTEMIEVSSGADRRDAHRFYVKQGYRTDHINFRKYPKKY